MSIMAQSSATNNVPLSAEGESRYRYLPEVRLPFVELSQKADLSIALILTTWPALSLSVTNNWGGPQSSEKRDWLGGAISDLITETPTTDMDVEYLEEFLLQVMLDEFEVVVDDGSAEEIASRILEIRSNILKGDVAGVEKLRSEWEERQRKGGVAINFVNKGEEDAETDGDSVDDEDYDEDDDVEMEDAPALVRAPKEKPVAEVDEDGFMTVVGRKKR